MRLTAKHIEQWVARYFPDYKRKSGGRQIRINNPFTDDDDFHFWISTMEDITKKGKKGFWVHDFRPGYEQYNTSFISFVRKYRNLSYFAAVAEIMGGDRKTLRDELLTARLQKDDDEPIVPIEGVKLPSASLPFSDHSRPMSRQMALNYLRTRCVSEELALKLSLYYTPSTIVFPYIEYGDIVFWQEREMLSKRFEFPNEAKTGLSKTNYLYNFDNVEPGDFVIVVESIFNSISIGDNCTASGGAIIAGRQPQKLKALSPSLVVLAPDRDKAGIMSMRKNFFLLQKDFKLAYSLPPVGIKDWNEMDQKDGVGAARYFVEKNTFDLTLPVLNRLLTAA